MQPNRGPSIINLFSSVDPRSGTKDTTLAGNLGTLETERRRCSKVQGSHSTCIYWRGCTSSWDFPIGLGFGFRTTPQPHVLFTLGPRMCMMRTGSTWGRKKYIIF